MDEEKRIDTDDIRKETTDTFNDVKEQVKGSFKKEELKNSAKETKGFVSEMFKNPIGELNRIANDNTNSSFKYVVILIAVWIAAIAIRALVLNVSWKLNIIKHVLLPVIKLVVAPIVGIIVMSAIIYFVNKKKDKNLTTILSVVTVAKLPYVVSSIVNLLRIFSSSVTRITSPFTTLCAVISHVLMFFGIKFLLGEEDDKEVIKKFVIIEAIYYIAYILIAFLEINI